MTPRQRLVRALTEALGAAIEAGDHLHAARVAHEALGRLLEPAQGQAPVADLGVERGRRRRD